MSNDSNILFYTKNARRWVEALPLGNGKIGAMVYGKTAKEIISLNYDELWTGFPRDYSDKDYSNVFKKARELALEGKYVAAQRMLESDFQNDNSQAYMPFGDLLLDFGRGKARAEKYERSLDLSTAVSLVKYEKSGVMYSREIFVSACAGAMVMNIRASEPVSFKIFFSTPLKSNSFVNAQGLLCLDGECPAQSEPNLKFNEKYQRYYEEDSYKGIHFRGAVKILSNNGSCLSLENSLQISQATNVTLAFSCESSFNGYNRHPFIDGKEYKNAVLEKLNGIKGNYEQLKQEHIDDYKRYYDRVSLDLGSQNKELVGTDKRLREFKKNKNDNGLISLLFNFGRYLTIAGSRENSQATNLQGIWNNEFVPPWNSNYTVNINTEMNYYPTLICNLPEMHLPLVEMVRELSQSGEITARMYYGAEGFTVHHNVDIWRHSSPVRGNACWSFWPFASGWLARHLFEHYEYTLDKDFLEKIAYPIIKKAAVFYSSLLIDDGKGALIFAPATSPENRFKAEGVDCAVSKTSTMSMAIIKELFANCIKSAEILGIKDQFTDVIREQAEKLLPFKTGSGGQLLEWYDEEIECEPHHRHVSHLYALHPADLITPDTTPELAEACRKTLELRGDGGTGWSLGWKINFWARLHDGNHALKLIEMQLNPVSATMPLYMCGGGTYPNMFDAHPPFQIDGNYGAASGIAEMLLQSHGNKIYLLPALPDAWKNGSVRGLKAKGNITVDIEWKNGKLFDYNLKGDTTGITVITG